MNDSVNEIVILSGKGGTGKTSLSAALATIGDKKTIADCDVDAANLYLILQPESCYEEAFITGFRAVIDQNLCIKCGKCITYCRFEAISIIDGSVCISQTSCDGCRLCTHVCPVEAITMKPSNKSRWYIGSFRNGTMVHARLAPGEDNSGKLVSVVREVAIREACELENHTVIIDGPPGTGCPAISSVTGARMAVVVTEPTRSGLHDLKRILELISNFNVPVSIVINKFDLNKSMSDEIGLYCMESQIPVIGRIPFDPNIVLAMIHCKSIVEWAPDSPASKEIYSIYHSIFSML
jgi:MinD superfamily P-loop ATPase